MPQANPENFSWQESSNNSKRLHSSLDKLQSRTKNYLTKKYGVSDNFVEIVDSQAAAMKLCEAAMEALANDYVEALVVFKEAQDPIASLENLEKAENIWQAETKVIGQLDKEGEEAAFLASVREQALVVMENRLEDVARECSKKPSPDNIALCLAVLGVMDSILAEFGQTEESPDRQRFRSIAKNFQ